ncbi:protocatechuate 3,4-dioxygenase subunit alpha [Amylibacter sp. IMCC11727]|uniref:protocatechuate 3,4-dioxygenase subunit alpha n=1 Tax=Amylibacter sp. IMCC11727 TaxID=3039851 RepID=UPI00244D9A7C|nr:protocatechuate 3,4-dioxygenase subunit alpha [Amylibacter sp. IMCC11727]WGI21391.1 protocatechuate 3,4-dioxygenase subunit alpha [Amylibacter sp. IMCC11727]
MGQLKESPSQTAGPYVHIGCVPNFAEVTGVYPADLGQVIARDEAAGQRITIKGRVIDGAGAPLLDAMIEVWHADANGVYASQEGADPHVAGFGRVAGDQDTGVFEITTIKPGSIGDEHAPHLSLWIVARGINTGLHTRMYFAGDPLNAVDPVLLAAGDRANTLIAHPDDGGDFVFDIHLQGPAETVFLDM